MAYWIFLWNLDSLFRISDLEFSRIPIWFLESWNWIFPLSDQL